MKICAAQTKPFPGEVEKNIEAHKNIISLAVSNEADMIVFPELSLTGYEPRLAKKLATNEKDPRLNEFQQLSNKNNIVVCCGIPVRTPKGSAIGMVIIQPHSSSQLYTKQFLHEDELPFFVSEQRDYSFSRNEKISLAICYEISVPKHSENASKKGTGVYIASVAKTARGMSNAIDTLTKTAKKYSMTVLLSNCIGTCDNMECGGRSSVWNNKGELLGQLNDTAEGILILDTVTMETIKLYL